ncbi:MAG: MerR family transcriptional regulator [Candidatus Dormiibacterota bacterium]
MASVSPSLARGGGLLKIGEAATLTGVSPGRIRHYQSQGLVRPSRSLSGYRYFNADDLVRILQIDLLRSLGMGLTDIRASLPGESHGESLRSTLAIHRNTLRAERDRLDRLLAAMEMALRSEDASAESVATLLASANSTPRDSLGIFGRLSRPLSEEAAVIYQEILGGGWGLPVPSIFGRMLLPPPVSDLLEQVAHAEGYQDLFRRVRDLAVEIISLATLPAPDPNAPVELARRWLERLLTDPLPAEVQTALDRTVPRIHELEVLNQGFQLWAESISPQAAEVLRALERLAQSRSLLVLGVLVAQPARRRGSVQARPALI